MEDRHSLALRETVRIAGLRRQKKRRASTVAAAGEDIPTTDARALTGPWGAINSILAYTDIADSPPTRPIQTFLCAVFNTIKKYKKNSTPKLFFVFFLNSIYSIFLCNSMMYRGTVSGWCEYGANLHSNERTGSAIKLGCTYRQVIVFFFLSMR